MFRKNDQRKNRQEKVTIMDPKSNAIETQISSSQNIPTVVDKFKMIAENITISYGDKPAVKDVTMKFKEKSVTALIGPSGCGKTTFLRCLNRMHDMTKNAEVEGKVMIDGMIFIQKRLIQFIIEEKLEWFSKNQILFQQCLFLIM